MRFFVVLGSWVIELVWPEERHARLGLNRIAIKGVHTLDVFAGKISYDFGLSDAMWERARNQRAFGKADLRYASPEDIFIMKLIANRPGDAPDCIALVSAGLDFDAIYGRSNLSIVRTLNKANR